MLKSCAREAGKPGLGLEGLVLFRARPGGGSIDTDSLDLDRMKQVIMKTADRVLLTCLLIICFQLLQLLTFDLL